MTDIYDNVYYFLVEGDELAERGADFYQGRDNESAIFTILDTKPRTPSFVESYDLTDKDNLAQIEAANALAGYIWTAKDEPEMFRENFEAMTHIAVLGQVPMPIEEIEGGIAEAARFLTNAELRTLVKHAHEVFPDSEHEWVKSPAFDRVINFYQPKGGNGQDFGMT